MAKFKARKVNIAKTKKLLYIFISLAILSIIIISVLNSSLEALCQNDYFSKSVFCK